MKQITLLFLIISQSIIYAQENFSVQYNLLSWQKSFITDISEEELNKTLAIHPLLSKINTKDSAEFEPIIKTCETRSTAIFMRQPFYGFSSITKTELGYKVTVSKIKFQQNERLRVGILETSDRDIGLEEYLLRKKDGTIRQNKQAKRDLECLDQTLTNLFSF